MTDSPIPRSFQSFPSPFVRALLHDSYQPGTSRFSVTGLISPPQRTWLKTFGEEVRSPYSMFAAMLGTAMHSIIEAHVDPEAGEIAEQRFYTDIVVDGESISVSGQVDIYETSTRTVSDYKLTSGIQEKMKPEHLLQTMMNGYLAELNGLEVKHVAVVYCQKDWSHMRSTVDPSYPQAPFTIFVRPFDRQLAIDTFNRTVRDHHYASKGQTRPCTTEEKWERPPTYALMKPSAKRASKLCATLDEAEQEKKPGQIIEHRKGEAVYCKNFCGYSKHCPQFARESNPQTFEP